MLISYKQTLYWFFIRTKRQKPAAKKALMRDTKLRIHLQEKHQLKKHHTCSTSTTVLSLLLFTLSQLSNCFFTSWRFLCCQCQIYKTCCLHFWSYTVKLWRIEWFCFKGCPAQRCPCFFCVEDIIKSCCKQIVRVDLGNLLLPVLFILPPLETVNIS